jgi:hypothetical protein
MRQMTTINANPGAPGRRNLVPQNKCPFKSCPLLNHFQRLPEIGAQKKAGVHFWQILADSVHFFLTFSCNYVNIIVEIYGYKADNENSLFSNVGFYILAQHLQICETRKPHLAL